MRHGTLDAYKNHGCRCDPCCASNTRYSKARRLDIMRGKSRTVDATGTRRRIRALHAMGWDGQAIADHAGLNSFQAVHNLTQRTRVRTASADLIARTYDALSMRVGPSATSRRRAATKGWPPPLAWDDIDYDEAPIGVGFRASTATGTWRPQGNDVDPVVVTRILAGDWRLPCTAAEKAAVVAAWDGSHNELARRTGWKIERYVSREDVA